MLLDAPVLGTKERAAVRHFLEGERSTQPDTAIRSIDPEFMRSLPLLTEAECRVLRHLKMGLSNKEVASAINRSHATVKNQVAAVLRKLGVPSRARLIALLWQAEQQLDAREDASPSQG